MCLFTRIRDSIKARKAAKKEDAIVMSILNSYGERHRSQFYVIGDHLIHSDYGMIKYCGLTEAQHLTMSTIEAAGELLDHRSERLCYAAECARIFQRLPPKYFTGYIKSYLDDPYYLETLASILNKLASGLLYSGKSFTMVIWPTRSEAWQWLNKKFTEVPRHSAMRFLVFFHAAPDPNPLACNTYGWDDIGIPRERRVAEDKSPGKGRAQE